MRSSFAGVLVYAVFAIRLLDTTLAAPLPADAALGDLHRLYARGESISGDGGPTQGGDVIDSCPGILDLFSGVTIPAAYMHSF
jgi:hypothetical protein